MGYRSLKRIGGRPSGTGGVCDSSFLKFDPIQLTPPYLSQFWWANPLPTVESVRMGMRGVFDERDVSDVTQQMRHEFLTATGIDPAALDVHNYTHPLLNVSLSFMFRYHELPFPLNPFHISVLLFFLSLSLSLSLFVCVQLLCRLVLAVLSPLGPHG
jgi:hypothetical protein